MSRDLEVGTMPLNETLDFTESLKDNDEMLNLNEVIHIEEPTPHVEYQTLQETADSTEVSKPKRSRKSTKSDFENEETE